MPTRSKLRGVLGALLLAGLVSAAAASAACTAKITGSFADSCRDFVAHSSKDISHVVIRYADGRVVKDESTTTPDFAIDGGPGDEIDSATVKSGRTRKTFTCARTNNPPTAVLEVKTPQSCVTWDDGLVDCDGRAARTAWTHSTIPGSKYGIVRFFCDWPDDQSCVEHEMPCGQEDGYSLCRVTYSLRGTSSTDPDGDIVSWSIEFGDGSTTSGNWTTNPPTEVSHEYQRHHCPTCSFEPATLTVTDSAGQTASDAQLPDHVYPE
jgi:PKD domain